MVLNRPELLTCCDPYNLNKAYFLGQGIEKESERRKVSLYLAGELSKHHQLIELFLQKGSSHLHHLHLRKSTPYKPFFRIFFINHV